MKLDYLPDGSPDCPMIRLYDFTPDEAAQLFASVTDLAAGAIERVEVHLLPCVEAIDGCQLTLIRRHWDQSTVLIAEPAAFECGLTAGAWDNMAGLIEPFVKGSGGFQWLIGSPDEAEILLSASGQW